MKKQEAEAGCRGRRQRQAAGGRRQAAGGRRQAAGGRRQEPGGRSQEPVVFNSCLITRLGEDVRNSRYKAQGRGTTQRHEAGAGSRGTRQRHEAAFERSFAGEGSLQNNFAVFGNEKKKGK